MIVYFFKEGRVGRVRTGNEKKGGKKKVEGDAVNLMKKTEKKKIL